MKTKNWFCAAVLLFGMVIAILTGCPENNNAQAGAGSPEFPNKPINIIVPLAAGGGLDLSSRVVAAGASQILRQAINVVNQPGGASIPAVENFLAEQPDGYTLLALNGTLIGSSAFFKTAWNPVDDFKPVIRMVSEPQFLWLHNKSAGGRFDSIDELIEYAKSHPGDVRFATQGAGSGVHFFLINLMQITGADITDVPFEGTTPIIAGVAGGFADICCVAVTGAKAMMEAGKLKMAATVDEQRDPRYSNIPTMRELGYDIINTSFWAIVAQKDVPDGVVKILHDAFKQSMETESTIATAKKLDYILSYADGTTLKQNISDLYTTYTRAMTLIEGSK
jgi:tripartite-type tricarboxylate transporter receptor subunit TctC